MRSGRRHATARAEGRQPWHGQAQGRLGCGTFVLDQAASDIICGEHGVWQHEALPEPLCVPDCVDMLRQKDVAAAISKHVYFDYLNCTVHVDCDL